VTASVSGNYQRNKGHAKDLRDAVDPTTGALSVNELDGIGRNLTRTPTERLNLSYALTPKDQLTGSVQLNQMLVEGHPFNRYVESAGDGTLLGLQNRQGSRRFTDHDSALTGSWKHSFSGEGHELSVDVTQNRTDYVDHTLWQFFQSQPPAAFNFERIFDDGKERHSELTVGYNRPLPGGASLKSGYELKSDDDAYDYRDFRGGDPAALPEIPSLANRFGFKQTINDAFATYERTLGDLSLVAGLRVEHVRLDLDQLTSGEKDSQDYWKAYPTLHLSYKLDEARKLTASFSERVNRPPSVLLNPLRYVIDPQDVQQGNPALKPQTTQSYELAFEEKPSGGGDYIATFYYRNNQGQFTQVLVPLGNGVFENTFENLGSSRDVGLELVANGKLTPKLSYNASANFYWKEISAQNLGFAGTRSAYGVSGRANLNWQARKDDLVQLNFVAYGKRLEAQGVDLPFWTVNLGWRHKVDDRMSLTFTAQDLFQTSRYRRHYDTEALVERFEFRPVSRAVFLRLDYRIGGRGKAAKDQPQFEYDNAPPPGPK
jgi:outer membrane receptor protein involved in Fe transport